MRKELTTKRLREVLRYNPRTGVFRWLVYRTQDARVGDRAGTIAHRGRYRRIIIDGTVYQCSHLAVLWMTGRWPKEQVDHRNGVRDDDRWRNLREATPQQNAANRKRSRARMLKGIFQSGKKYGAQIVVNKKRVYLGTFISPDQAHAAYIIAAKRAFGAFASFD